MGFAVVHEQHRHQPAGLDQRHVQRGGRLPLRVRALLGVAERGIVGHVGPHHRVACQQGRLHAGTIVVVAVAPFDAGYTVHEVPGHQDGAVPLVLGIADAAGAEQAPERIGGFRSGSRPGRPGSAACRSESAKRHAASGYRLQVLASKGHAGSVAVGHGCAGGSRCRRGARPWRNCLAQSKGARCAHAGQRADLGFSGHVVCPRLHGCPVVRPALLCPQSRGSGC